MRLKIIRLIISLMFLAVAADLFYLQILRGKYYYDLSVNNRIRVVPMEARRGRILDRNGVILADNRMAFDVAVIPQETKDKKELFQFLAKAMGQDVRKIEDRFQQKKVAPFAPVVVAEDVNKETAMALEENKFRFPGLYIEQSIGRAYPLGPVGAHVLGYVGKISPSRMEKLKEYGYTPQSVVGYSGLEEYYDQYLKGTEGGLQIEVNSRGQQVRLLGIREPSKGRDLQVTLDARVQQQAATLLGDRRGAVVVMDLDSGELLGLVSAPSYDPNVFTDAKLKSQAGPLFVDPHSPLLNRAIKGMFPPGSVFKLIGTIGGMETGKITPHTTFTCSGAYTLGRRQFRCLHVHGPQDLLQAIRHSCNVYFFNVGATVGPDVLAKYAKMFGLGSATEVDLPSESKGVVPSPMQRRLSRKEGWYKGDTLNYSIGQGDLTVTPLQLVRMVATIARDGKEVQPHFLKKIGDQEIVSLSPSKQVHVDPFVLDFLKDALRAVVRDEDGTAHTLESTGLGVAGKTGTAQAGPDRDSHAWFVGYTTQGEKKIAFCVFLEHGGSSYNAVVLSKELLTFMREEGVL